MLILIGLLISTNSFAGDKWEELNKVFNPKIENEIGYGIEYRVDHRFSWVNITKLKKICEVNTTTFLKDNKLAKITKYSCKDKWMVGDKEPHLFQITCRNKLDVCKKLLDKQLNEKIIREMIFNNETDVVIE